MSASASVYTLALLLPLRGGRSDLALPAPPFPRKGAPGLAEAQRLEHGPRLQGNGLVGRHPLRSLPFPEGTLLEAQQEFGLGASPPRRNSSIRPELRQEHPLNLSISISGGKETN